MIAPVKGLGGIFGKKGRRLCIVPERRPGLNTRLARAIGRFIRLDLLQRLHTALPGLRSHLRPFLGRKPGASLRTGKTGGGVLRYERRFLGSRTTFEDSDEALQAGARNLHAENALNLQEQPTDRTVAPLGHQVRPAQSCEVFHRWSQLVARASTFQHPDQLGRIALQQGLSPAPDRFGIDSETFAQSAQLDLRVVESRQQEFEGGIGGIVLTVSMRTRNPRRPGVVRPNRPHRPRRRGCAYRSQGATDRSAASGVPGRPEAALSDQPPAAVQPGVTDSRQLVSALGLRGGLALRASRQNSAVHGPESPGRSQTSPESAREEWTNLRELNSSVFSAKDPSYFEVCKKIWNPLKTAAAWATKPSASSRPSAPKSAG